MNGNARIAEHRFWTGRSDFHILVFAFHLISDMIQMTSFRLVFNFNIAQSRIAVRTPVRYALALINEAFLI